MDALQGPGTHSAGDLEAAFKLLMHADDASAIGRLIETQPLVNDPLFHSLLRQRRLQLHEADASLDGLREQFMTRHDVLFTMLHMRAHAQACTAAVPVPQAAVAAFGSTAPELFAVILDSLKAAGHVLPPTSGPTHYLPDGWSALEAELRSLLPAGAPPWPAWVPRAGGVFGLLRLSCMCCREPRLALRAWAVNPQIDKTFENELLDGRLNADLCARCGSALSWPDRIWVAQLPRPQDPLATLTCLFMRNGHERIYLPPTGAVRIPAFDRVMEARLEMLGRQLGPDWSFDLSAGSGVFSDGVAYGIEDLRRRLAETRDKPPAELEYDDIVEQITHRLRLGELAYRDAEAFLDSIAGTAMARWPVVVAEGGEPVEVLVRRMVLEGCLRAQGASAGVLCAAAASVAQAYCALGQVALAEMSMARANDRLAQADGGAVALRRNVLAAQESLHIARGEMDLAAKVRAEIRQPASASSTGVDSNLSTISDEELAMNEALFARHRGDLTGALAALMRVHERFAQLEGECGRAADQSGELRARQGRSGCIANIGSLKAEAAAGFDLLQQIAAVDGDVSRLTPSTVRQVQRLGDASRASIVLGGLADRWASTHPVSNVAALRAQAEADLRHAIDLATQTGHSEYLGIQNLELARLLRECDREDEAYALLPLAIRHANDAGDQQHVAAGAWELARQASKRADLPGELGGLETLMRSEIRAVIEGRSSAGDLSRTAAMAVDAVCAANVSAADIARAIAIAESGKRVAMARSMRLGPAWVPDAGAASSKLTTLMAEREALRQAALWGSSSEGDEAAARLDELILAERVALAQRDPRYAAWHDATWVGLATVPALRRAMARIGPRTTMMGVVANGSMAYAYALWTEGAAAVAHPSVGDPGRWLPQLVEKLLPRLRPLGADDLLLISPCAELDAISWAELPVDGKPLIARAALAIVTGAGVLEICSARKRLAPRAAACLGAPHRPGFAFLDGARDEVEQVAARLAKAGLAVKGPFVGLQANVANLRCAAENSDLVHLACHGEADADGGVSLMLTPNLIQGDSGVVGADLVMSSLKLADGAMVVLAACSSANAGIASRFIEPGQIHAWLIAGAATVLACLRPIGDEAARGLHASFYGYLLEGDQAAVALARTQRDAARGALGHALADPDQWGAYVLFGT
ncbi:MAG: CHAT domain-containing protein [Comamonadaceae bacterium]|nr:CHAT domain-containing protein [Comamonadaceae bacterium]